MRITLAICVFLVTSTYADTIVPYFNAANLLKNIEATCLNPSEYETLAGDGIKHTGARILSGYFISKHVMVIACTEFRAACNFAPLNPSKYFNNTEPNEEELSAASTIEEYYNLKEARSSVDATDSDYVMDQNIPPAIELFDRRYPSIRNLFRRKIQEILRSNGGEMTRETINRWINELYNVNYKILRAFHKSIDNLELKKAWNCSIVRIV